MSTSPTSFNRNSRWNKNKSEDNNNTKFNLQQARSFISWYKQMIDNERSNLSLYLSDDAILEWFGRTIKTRKKLSGFLKHDMQCSRHYLTSVENIENIQLRSDRQQRKDDSILASPLHSPEMVTNERLGKKKLFQSRCGSPEWAEGCGPDKPPSESKKDIETISEVQFNGRKRLFSDETEFHSKGDGVSMAKRKCIDDNITPPNKELGQGDCLPSTSGTDSDRSHDTLNAQLPKLAVECNGYIEFARTRNSRSLEAMKWERKCKIQISYSEDPLNIGEYIIWMIRYTDETKCRRNLLAAFEEASVDETPII